MRLLWVAVLGWAAAACSREPTPSPVAPASAPALTATPLPSRAASDGPRFERLAAATTGLRFTNRLATENVVPYVYSGGGVTVGDYDGDGLPDVYLVALDGPNRLFRQVAPMQFVDVTEAAGGLDGGDAWGTAAAFVDLDGDGDLDLYVCNLESPNLLFLNQGNGTFRECAGPFGLAITAASTGCAFADFDRDGDLDLYLLTNRVFGPRLPQEIVDETRLPGAIRKTKAELFPPPPRFSVRDGKPVVPAGAEDFYAVVEDQIFAAGQPDRLLRNDGYGHWRDVTEAAGIRDHGNGLSAVWWDCDDDGWLDLYVANDLESPDQLWRNRGDGTFVDITETALPHTAYFGMGADFGDLDQDGRFDFLVGDMSSTSHYMGKMLMGSMGDRRWFLMHSRPQQYMRNALYWNTGTGRFLEAAWLSGLASTDWTWTVRFADLDEDGRLDLFATNGIPRFEDNPDTVAEFQRLWSAGQRTAALALARSIEPVRERNIARRNLGGMQFADAGPGWGLDEASVGQAAVIADFDRDGDLDILVNNLNQEASLFANRSADAHRITVELQGTASNRQGIGSRIELAAGGVSQVRLMTVARGYMSSGEAREHFGLGAATRVDRLTVRWPSGAVQEFRDLAADRHYAIREPAADPARTTAPPAASPGPAPGAAWFADGPPLPVTHREREFDDYAVQPLLPHRLSRLGPGIAMGDVDGDGRDDLWLGGAAGQPGTLCRAEADGRFTPLPGPWDADRECEDLGALLLDADGDGDLDLLVASGGIEAGTDASLLRARLYRNEGGGRFTKALAEALPERAFSAGCLAAADFDRDGDLDVFVGARVVPGRFPEAPASALWRNDGGRFVEVTEALAPALRGLGMVSGATWTDLDGDGYPDLAVAAQWQPVRILHNDGGARLVDRTAALGLDRMHGQWNGIAAGDLDGDGDLDLVVTNLGLNSKYKATPEQPLRLFAADFDRSGTLDVIEAKSGGRDLLPVRGRSCSTAAIPPLATRFPTYDAFARATLPEIYGQDQLDRALELHCDQLRHVVLENRGATFAVQPLPHAAQIAPCYGIGIADFDGDGVQDLALATNSFSPEPETGRMDGGLGLVLRGRGDGTFAALPPAESGVVLRGDQKALVVGDFDRSQRPGLAIATNDGPVRVLVPQRSAGDAGPVAVRLRGRAGNPAATGARITLLRPDGTRQTHELHAGSGYLSQGPQVAWLTRVPEGSKVEVRWPDGSVTEHALGGAARSLVLTR